MEVQFYLLVPLLTLLFLVRNRWLRRTTLAALAIAIPAVVHAFIAGKISGHSHFWATIGWLLQYFIAGMLLSDIYVTEMPSWRASWVWDVVSGAGWCSLLFSAHGPLYFVESLLIALAFVGAFRGVLLHRLLTIEWLATIGGMCYSIYLWHFFIIALVFKASRHLLLTHDLLANFLVQSVLILPCILAFSIAYFVAIERPCMDPAWPQKLWAALSGSSRRPEAAESVSVIL
jgi:peptidoglycan/LPS O-acetylase OafA/YrhL